MGISICAADNGIDDVSMDEEISVVEEGFAAMTEENSRKPFCLERLRLNRCLTGSLALTLV